MSAADMLLRELTEEEGADKAGWQALPCAWVLGLAFEVGYHIRGWVLRLRLGTVFGVGSRVRGSKGKPWFEGSTWSPCLCAMLERVNIDWYSLIGLTSNVFSLATCSTRVMVTLACVMKEARLHLLEELLKKLSNQKTNLHLGTAM